MNEPTNADIFKALGTIDQRLKNIDGELKGIHIQTQKTNGRVTRLEQRNEREDDRKEWQKEQDSKIGDPIPTLTRTPEGQTVDLTKIILALIGLSSSLVALAQFIASQQK